MAGKSYSEPRSGNMPSNTNKPGPRPQPTSAPRPAPEPKRPGALVIAQSARPALKALLMVLLLALALTGVRLTERVAQIDGVPPACAAAAA